MTGAVVDLHELRRQHGGQVYDGGRRWVGPGPGHTRGDRSLSVSTTADGRALVHSFAGDGFGACAEHLGLERDRASKLDRATADRLRREREAESRRRTQQALAFCERLWRVSTAVSGTLGEQYLVGRAIEWLPDDVRFHPACPRGYQGDAGGAALLALARNPAGEPVAVQATHLKPDASKSGRVTLGSLRGGAAVRLSPPGAILAVAEGLETAASYGDLEALPCWATLGTSGLVAFDPPLGVKRLVVAADGDEAGLRAAHALAERVKRRCDVTIAAAPTGMDWNDVAGGGRHG